MKKHNWKRTMFYIRRELIRWAVMLVGTLAALCLGVLLLEDPNSRLMVEITLGFFAALWMVDKIYHRKEEKEE